MKLEQLFPRIGLGSLSTRAYRALEKEGPQLITELVSSSGLYRPSLYRALTPLTQKGLVVARKRGKRTVYEAVSRTRLLVLFSTEQSAVEKLACSTSPIATSVTNEIHLSGSKGIQAAFDDVIEHLVRGDTFYRYTSERDLDKVNSYLSPDYRTRRDRKRLERLVISNATSGSRKISRLERFVKHMPQEAGTFNQNIIQLVYGDRVSFIDLTAERVLIIENKALAEFQKTIFKQLYKKL